MATYGQKGKLGNAAFALSDFLKNLKSSSKTYDTQSAKIQQIEDKDAQFWRNVDATMDLGTTRYNKDGKSKTVFEGVRDTAVAGGKAIAGTAASMAQTAVSPLTNYMEKRKAANKTPVVFDENTVMNPALTEETMLQRDGQNINETLKNYSDSDIATTYKENIDKLSEATKVAEEAGQKAEQSKQAEADLIKENNLVRSQSGPTEELTGDKIYKDMLADEKSMANIRELAGTNKRTKRLASQAAEALIKAQGDKKVSDTKLLKEIDDAINGYRASNPKATPEQIKKFSESWLKMKKNQSAGKIKKKKKKESKYLSGIKEYK